MELTDLIALVGQDQYEAARVLAWESASTTGGRPVVTPADEVVGAVTFDLAQLWDMPALTPAERLALARELYEDMPCYENTLGFRHEYDSFDPALTDEFWTFYRRLLGSVDDRLAEPIAYSLWCDYFEDPNVVALAWRAVTAPGPNHDRRIGRVLRVSGPVPWHLKYPLLTHLAYTPSWHDLIFQALFAARFDAFGKLDKSEAATLLARLRLSHSSVQLSTLQAALTG